MEMAFNMFEIASEIEAYGNQIRHKSFKNCSYRFRELFTYNYNSHKEDFNNSPGEVQAAIIESLGKRVLNFLEA